jgi:hypothetical protein
MWQDRHLYFSSADCCAALEAAGFRHRTLLQAIAWLLYRLFCTMSLYMPGTKLDKVKCCSSESRAVNISTLRPQV